MKFRPLILKFAAIFMLLVFLQKTGAGLFVHNLFHQQGTAPTEKQNEQSTELSYACSCMDDFLLPFEPASAIAYAAPFIQYQSFTTTFAAQLIITAVPYSSLRGPPALLAFSCL
jgi:hypothetical protein